MPVAADVSAAGLGARRGIDPDLESLRVDVVGQRLHVRKLAIGVEHSLRVAFTLPGVVDVDVDVSGVAHAAGDQSVGRGAHIGISHLGREVVPAVPAHGRRSSKLRRLSGGRNVSGYEKGEGSDESLSSHVDFLRAPEREILTDAKCT